jgi:hypothetical protein
MEVSVGLRQPSATAARILVRQAGLPYAGLAGAGGGGSAAGCGWSTRARTAVNLVAAAGVDDSEHGGCPREGAAADLLGRRGRARTKLAVAGELFSILVLRTLGFFGLVHEEWTFSRLVL